MPVRKMECEIARAHGKLKLRSKPIGQGGAGMRARRARRVRFNFGFTKSVHFVTFNIFCRVFNFHFASCHSRIMPFSVCERMERWMRGYRFQDKVFLLLLLRNHTIIRYGCSRSPITRLTKTADVESTQCIYRFKLVLIVKIKS